MIKGKQLKKEMRCEKEGSKLKLKNKIGKKKRNIYIIISAIALLVIGVSVFWVSGIFKNNNNEPDKTVETTPEAPNDEKKLQIVDINSTSRPYAIMINNINVARPLQSGLQDAYIIYEMIVEGGITRYMALFLDQNTERIGSIRSARHYYLDYALENDAIYVHHGQSPQAQRDFSSLDIDRIAVDNTKTGWRDNTLNVSTEHRLFTSIEKLNSGLGNIRTERKNDLLLNYSIDELDLSKYDNAKTANEVTIKYSGSVTNTYEYDSDAKVYKRYVNGEAHTDYVTKEQYTFKNIITYQVRNYTINDGENKGRQELENIGSGTGYYISDGYAVPIKWEKSSRSSQTKYYFENGEELIVNDGNTFIQIQPMGQTLTIK